MKIDWRSLPPGYDAIPAEIDWSDPTHVPLMVADIVIGSGGGETSLSDEETAALQVTALDAMPGGRDEVVLAVRGHLYEIAASGGWSEWLFEPGTARYPWVP